MSLAAPQTTRYKPEEILVAKSFDIPGNSFMWWDQWRRIPPSWIRFTRFATEQTPDARIRVTADTETNVFDEHADACLPLSQSQIADIFAHRLMMIHVANQSAIAMNDYQFRYRYLVDDWTVAEKIRRGVLKVTKQDVGTLTPNGTWTSEELRLNAKFSLVENVFAGRLPYQVRFPGGFPYGRDSKLDQQTIIRIQDVARTVAIAAGSVADPTLQTDIGPMITVPEDEKVVLFEIATDQPTDPANGTFIVVDRDTNQNSYMQWNTYCFAGIDHPDGLWVPSLEQLFIHARSVAGEAAFKIRYKYVRCKLTLIDKIRWNLDMMPSEVAVCDKLDLWDRIAAGVV